MTKKFLCLFALISLVAAPFVSAQPKEDSATEPVAVASGDPAAKALEGKTAPGVKETLAAQADVSVETVAAPQAQEVVLAAEAEIVAPGEDFVAPREELQEAVQEAKAPRVVYNPKNRRDPTLSPDDFLLLQYREQQRLAALEAERQRKRYHLSTHLGAVKPL